MQKVNASPSLTASATVGNNNAVYFGYTVTVATATAAILIRQGSGGQIVDTIPAATAAGATKSLANGLALSSLYVDFNGGTGTVVVHYQ